MGVYSVLGFVLLAAAFGGPAYILATRSGADANVRLALAQQGIGRLPLVGATLVGSAGIAATLAVGSPPLGGAGAVGFLLGSVLLLSGVGLAGLAVGRYPQYRLLESVDANAARDCEVGDAVGLAGEVGADGDLLVSPWSETPCVAYDSRIETKTRTINPPVTFWIVDDRQTDRRPFTLTDDTGTVAVDSTNARVLLSVSSASTADDATGFLQRVFGGHRSEGPNGPASRYSERVLEPGDLVHVLGTVVERDGTAVVEAEEISDRADAGTTLYRAVRRNGPLGVGLALVGLFVLFTSAGIL